MTRAMFEQADKIICEIHVIVESKDIDGAQCVELRRGHILVLVPSHNRRTKQAAYIRESPARTVVI